MFMAPSTVGELWANGWMKQNVIWESRHKPDWYSLYVIIKDLDFQEIVVVKKATFIIQPLV